jgi:polyhydroxyalkanoate synthesis regulator phasin
MKQTAAERLTAAKAELAETERAIELAPEIRRRALIDGQSEAIVAEANRHLAYLWQRRQDLADKIAWLPERIAAEESEAAWPSSAAAIQALIDKLSRRLSVLTKRTPRAAAEDAEIDSLKQRVPALQQRLELMTKFETIQ